MATLHQLLWPTSRALPTFALRGRYATRAPFHTTHRDADATQHGRIAAGARLRGCPRPSGLWLHTGATPQCCTLSRCLALTAIHHQPGELRKLLALRDEMTKPEHSIAGYLSSWKCPTHPDGTCDPCGSRSGADDSWGHDGGGWEHIACRTYDLTAAETGGSTNGIVTNIHITDLKTTGTLASLGPALCPFNHLRELDLDGGRLTGPLPHWLVDCYPYLRELDLSFNQLSGSIPSWVTQLARGNIWQIKLEQNALSGPIPLGLGYLPQLRVLWLAHNNLEGMLPQDLAATKSLISIDTRYNSRMCGPLPAGLHVERVPDGNWQGFCDKAYTEDSACAVLTFPGTGLGVPCGMMMMTGM